MLIKNDIPILEFDEAKEALINPCDIVKRTGRIGCERLVITFFGEVIEELLSDGKIEKIKTVIGENPYVIYKFRDCDVLIMHGDLGCPAMGGELEELIAIGVKKVMFCGGGGVLDRETCVGHFLVVEGAIRDDGFSYHYIPASRIVYTEKDTRKLICDYLSERGIPHSEGLVWTTDAFFRETRDRIRARREEGAKIVEMEQAGCIAVTQFRGVGYGAIIYGGDDISGDGWDSRSWRSRDDIRRGLVDICREIVLLM